MRSSSIIAEYLRKGLTIEQIKNIALERNIIIPQKVIEKAKIACEESGNIIDDHFAHVSEMVKIGSSASRVLPILCKKYVINLTN